MNITFTRFSMALFLVVTFQSALARAADGPKCKPSYRVDFVPCKTQPTGAFEIKTITDRVATAVCKPNESVVCEGYAKDSFMKNHTDVVEDHFRLVDTYHKDTIGNLCGDPLRGDVRAKADVYCTFQYQTQSTQPVADESCPVKMVSEVTGCYTNSPRINLDVETIQGCLAANPLSEAELWIKSACLFDASRAQNNFRLLHDLPEQVYQNINEQLKIIESRPNNSPALNTFIRSETQK
jgi:hypothetical protein